MSPRVSGLSAGPATTTAVYDDSFFLPFSSLSVSGSAQNGQLVVREQSTELVPTSRVDSSASSRSIHSAAEAPIVMSRKTFQALKEYLINLGKNSKALEAERDLLTKDNALLKSQIEQLKPTLDAGWTAQTTSLTAKVNTLFQKLELLNQTVTQAHQQTCANVLVWKATCAQINASNEDKAAWNRSLVARCALHAYQSLAPLPDPATCVVSGITAAVFSYYEKSITPLIQEVNKLQAALPNLPAQARKEAQEAWEAAPSEPPSEEKALVPLTNETPVSEEFLDLMEEEDLQLEKENTLVRAEKLLFEGENLRLSAEKTKLQEVDAKAIAIYQKLVKQHLTLPTEREEQDPIRINYDLLCQSNCPTILPKLNQIISLIQNISK